VRDVTQPRLLGGRYELDGIVGRGGMAEVFRARDIRLDRIVAVKTLREDLARDQTFQARFRREAQSAASLNHPSIVAVYDTGEDMAGAAPVPYIVMEYVDGRTLRDLLRDDRRLLPERAAEITDGVLRALDYSHRHGIIHRDIKPGNVMLTRTGEIKVMDFGIARAVSDAQATMTQTAQVIGTAQYLSPEQARGERVDARSDLYSCGCLFYELLTGRPPFTGDSPVAIAYQHVRENPVPPTRVDPEVPAWADAIVLKAMAKDPAARYQSAGDMRNDIQRALSGVPVAAPFRGDYGAGTRRMGAATAVAGPTSAIPAYSYGPPEDGEEEQAGGGRRAWPWLLALLIAALLIGGGYALYSYISSSGGQVQVPSVAGKKLAAAETAIQKAGLRVGPVRREHSGTPKGEVVKTSPAGGSSAAKNSPVTIFVSSGARTTSVPYVTQLKLSRAETVLSQHGLKWTVKRVAGAGTPGTVTSQNPAGGTTVRAGSTVALSVTSGGVNVPSVIGESQGQASAVLQQAGFRVVPVTEPAPAGTPEQVGYVFGQTPAGNTTAPQGSTVYIKVVAQTSSPSPSPTSSPSPSPSPTTSQVPGGTPP
jgi:eukaryotic-like serine/threonine-protein kinase